MKHSWCILNVVLKVSIPSLNSTLSSTIFPKLVRSPFSQLWINFCTVPVISQSGFDLTTCDLYFMALF